LITVEHLKKQYAATTAVDDISFEVKKHEILGFLGPNGAGKSTTLRILTGYLAATSGSVVIDGHNVFTEPEVVKRVIGYLPENVPLYTELRVEEYLKYRAALKKVPFGKQRAQVASVLERCRITDVRRRIIGQLSKGYRQRVGIADALVGDPRILILDEPSIGLDPNQIRQIRTLIRELGKERTVILSSHILPEVEAVCSRVLIINKGRIVGQGKPEELRTSLRSGRCDILVEVIDPKGTAENAIKRLDGIRSLSAPTEEGEHQRAFTATTYDNTDGKTVREQIFDAAVDAGFKLVGLSQRGASLEDIFVEITTSEASVDEALDAAADDTDSGKGGDA
jgi:ABC-2 type transport system ATP-binding protein